MAAATTGQLASLQAAVESQIAGLQRRASQLEYQVALLQVQLAKVKTGKG